MCSIADMAWVRSGVERICVDRLIHHQKYKPPPLINHEWYVQEKWKVSNGRIREKLIRLIGQIGKETVRISLFFMEIFITNTMVKILNILYYIISVRLHICSKPIV